MRYRHRAKTRYVILHDSHTPPSIITPLQWLRHNGRVTGLLDIGYNAVIDRNGVITETRPRDAVGSHTPAYNHESIGVCLIGGLGEGGAHEDNFTLDQKFSLGAIFKQFEREFGPLELVGHTELQRFKHRPGAKCPALNMGELREFIKENFK